MFLTFKFFTKLEIIGKENLKNIKGPVIFISNHASYFDPYIIGAAIPLSKTNLYPVHYLAYDKLFKNYWLKVAIECFGAFPGKIGEGINEAMKEPLELLKNKKTIGIFPEWCYKNEPEASRVRKVISSLSIKTNTPIIPIFIFGIYNHGISWKKIFNRERKIKITFGEPIYPNTNSEEKMEELISKSHIQVKLTLIKALHEEEKIFWSHYAKFYYYLERAIPYKQLIENFDKALPEKIKGEWIDFGSGSGAIVELLSKKINGDQANILATDNEQKMLNYISDRFRKNKKINIKKIDLALFLDFSDNYFDGVTANLVFPYIMHHQGEIGLDGFTQLLKDVHRILKPNGTLVWSSPKNKVKFHKVFLASWRNIIDPENLNHIYYGPAILKQALQIECKGKCGIYNFLKTDDLKNILTDIGFKDIDFSRSMAGQVDIISCRKK
jgi:1-acyl-sn-glycerol-3-phosphate acyltransferase